MFLNIFWVLTRFWQKWGSNYTKNSWSGCDENVSRDRGLCRLLEAWSNNHFRWPSLWTLSVWDKNGWFLPKQEMLLDEKNPRLRFVIGSNRARRRIFSNTDNLKSISPGETFNLETRETFKYRNSMECWTLFSSSDNFKQNRLVLKFPLNIQSFPWWNRQGKSLQAWRRSE